MELEALRSLQNDVDMMIRRSRDKETDIAPLIAQWTTTAEELANTITIIVPL